MNKSISRRGFSLASLMLPLAANGVTLGAAQTAGSDAVLGGTRQAFDTVLGASRQESDFAVYDATAERPFAYWVRFNAEDIADYILIDFTTVPAGGLEFDESGLGTSRFIPQDAVFAQADGRSIILPMGSAYYARHYTSNTVATQTGAAGNLLIVDEYGPGRDGPYLGLFFFRTYIGLEAAEVNPVTGSGVRPGLGATHAEWEAGYGPTSPAQNGWASGSGSLPGSMLIDMSSTNPGDATVTLIEFYPDPPMPTSDAATLVSEMFQPDMQQQAYWFPPVNVDGLGMRIHVLTDAQGGSYFAMQIIRGDEVTGSVERIILF